MRSDSTIFSLCAWLFLPTTQSESQLQSRNENLWESEPFYLQYYKHDQNHRQMKQSELHGLLARLKHQRVLEGLLKVLPCTNQRTLQAQSGWQATQKRKLYPCSIIHENVIQIRLKIVRDRKQHKEQLKAFEILRSNYQSLNQWWASGWTSDEQRACQSNAHSWKRSPHIRRKGWSMKVWKQEMKQKCRKKTKICFLITRFYTNTNNYTTKWNLHYYTTGDLRKTKSQKHKKTRWERWTHRQNQSKGWIALNGLSLLREGANQCHKHSHVESVREYSQKIQHDERTACIRSHRCLNEG